MKCPWCASQELEGEFIRLFDETVEPTIVWLQQISPLRCQRCGAVEIGPYDIADGKRPTLIELEKGWYQSENLSWKRRRKARNNPRRRRKRRNESIRLHVEDESLQRKPIRGST